MFHIKFKPRLYQERIFHTCTLKNTLIVLPTGLGKTNIFVMCAVHRLNLYPNSKIVLLGPTKPLVDQYFNVFINNTDIPKELISIFTGKVNPEKRKELWKSANVILSTPQGFENDILSKRISLENVSLIGFDEAHKAVGDYSYVWIAKEYNKQAKYPRIIGMTASPGSDIERIKEVCKNLFIEAIEIRTEYDSDVKPYIKEKKIQWLYIDLPENFAKVRELLQKSYLWKLQQVSDLNLIPKEKIKELNKKELLELQASIRKNIDEGNKNHDLFKALSLLAECMKVQHAIELLETQDIFALKNYIDNLYNEALRSNVKSSKNLFEDPYFKSAYYLIDLMYQNEEKHPKLIKLKEIVKNIISENRNVKIIVFTQYRDSVKRIVNELNSIENVKAVLFVGQSKKYGIGLSQKEQKEIIEKFSSGEYNVLVSTSVGEEGLDIPSVDYVIFYEPVPSAIRQIQRRGRTGRQEFGNVIILITRDTRDEIYRWSAFHKEKRMYRVLENLKKNIHQILEENEKKNVITLNKFIEPKLKVVADFREKNSVILRKLSEMNVDIELKNLEIGDYVLSEDVCIEVKTITDFVNSLIDGRIFNQAINLKNYYTNPFIIIYGQEDMFSIRNVNPNALRGLIISLINDYKIPLIFAKNAIDAANYIYLLIKQEQEIKKKNIILHKKKPKSIKEIQEYIISAIPGIGYTLAKPLLKEFKTIKNIANAKIEELAMLPLIGEEKSKMIYRIFNEEYKED